jgi:ATP-binding cassette subfamily B protein/subfamily B ATP-binding cassette protein MsbA
VTELARQLARIAPYLRPYRWRFLAAASLVVAIGAAEVGKPWPLKVVIDNVLGGKPLPVVDYPGSLAASTLLVLAVAGLVLLYVVLGALSVASNSLTIDVGQRMVNDFRSDLYQHLQRLSLRFHSQSRSGDLMYRLTADTFAIQTLAMNGCFPMLSALVMLLAMVFVMARLDLQLTGVALAICPLLAASISRVGRRITRVATDAREKESQLYSAAQRAMSSIKVILAFTTEDEEHRSFIDVSRASLLANLNLYTVQTAYAMLVNVIGALGTAAVVWLGASHVLAGTLSVGELLVFTSYLASLYAPINTISSTFGLIHGATVGIGRVFEILETAPDVPDGTRELAREDVRGEVIFDSVSFSYVPGQPVLRDVSFTVAPGEMIAIVGPTGAGKTTLVSLLVRFYDPSSGAVRLDGQDLRQLRVRSLRQQVAMVLQPPLVFPTTLGENVAYGRRGATRREIEEAAAAAQLGPLLDKLPAGLDTPIGERGATLSEGECQRLTIARALLRDAPILILDEPTSALDAETEALLMGSVERLMQGRTSFVIAHRLSTVRRASRIMVLRDGRIVELGSFAELMARRGYFARLHDTQFGTGSAERVRAAT